MWLASGWRVAGEWLVSGWRVAGDGVKLTTSMRVQEVVMVVLVVEEVKVAVMAGPVVTVTMAVMAEAVMWEGARRQPQQADRADRGAVADDGGEGSSWDRCDRCMAVLPAPRPAGQRAAGGWSRPCTTVGLCHLASRGCPSTLHTQ